MLLICGTTSLSLQQMDIQVLFWRNKGPDSEIKHQGEVTFQLSMTSKEIEYIFQDSCQLLRLEVLDAPNFIFLKSNPE